MGAGAGLLLWWLFDSPVVALVTTLGVDFAGAIPTIRKAWVAPHTEDRLAWALFIAGNTFNLVAVDRWEFAIAIYPIYFFLASGTIAALVPPSQRQVIQPAPWTDPRLPPHPGALARPPRDSPAASSSSPAPPRPGHCLATFALGFDREMDAYPNSGLLDGLPDMRAVFDPASIRPGWTEGTGRRGRRPGAARRTAGNAPRGAS